MSTKEIQNDRVDQKRLIEDSIYYKYIFKKTEKITCAVLYILRSDLKNKSHDQLVLDIEDAARLAHSEIIYSLDCQIYNSAEIVRICAHKLVSLESRLRVGHASKLISLEILNVISTEIEGVLRSMSRYMKTNISDVISTESNSASIYKAYTSANKSARKTQNTQEIDVFTTPTISQRKRKTQRRDRIVVVLRSLGKASVKDISNEIEESSEKTIQRELQIMVTEGLLSKTGERRWSKYSLNS